VEHVARILNERLAGLSLRDIRATLAARLRDADGSGQSGELLNIFVAEGEEIFDLGPDPVGGLGLGLELQLPFGLFQMELGASSSGRRRFDINLGTRF